MDSKMYFCESLDDIAFLSAQILSDFEECKIFTFHGQLGAGKTTLIKYLSHHLGYFGEVTSPTFSLINEYDGTFAKIYHMDLYRLKDLDEALDIGLEEYLYSGNYCFIEWPILAEEILDTYCQVKIEIVDALKRKIEVNYIR